MSAEAVEGTSGKFPEKLKTFTSTFYFFPFLYGNSSSGMTTPVGT